MFVFVITEGQMALMTLNYTFFTVVMYVKPGLVFVSTTVATRTLLLGDKPRMPLKRKDVEPGPVKISPVPV